jgi:hypothetical protein
MTEGHSMKELLSPTRRDAPRSSSTKRQPVKTSIVLNRIMTAPAIPTNGIRKTVPTVRAAAQATKIVTTTVLRFRASA